MRSAVLLLFLVTPAAADNVLVWLDAPLRLDPSDAAPSIHLGELAKRTANYVVPMHQVGMQGEFVEVEPTADIECAWSKVNVPAGLAKLRLFVKKSDLAPVVAKPFTASFKDGSRIALQPGVSVQDGLVAFVDQVIPVDAPTAFAYAPHPIAAIAKPGKHTVLLDEHTDVTFGGKSFQLGPWVAASAENRGARVLFPIAVRCATAVVSAPKDHVQHDVSLGSLTGQEMPPPPLKPAHTEYHLAKGQALTSESGTHVVATLAEDRDVAKPTGAMACADFIVDRDEPLPEAPRPDEASRPNRTLHLCAPAANVKH